MNELDKAERMGYLNTSRNLGYLFVASEDDESKKLDKTNNMIPILCEGRLFLDSISSEDIKTDQRTGRKYVNVTFRKSRLLDAFGNSHEFVVKTDYGEHQIGVARQIDIEPSPESQEMASRRDERTVEQRCPVADEPKRESNTPNAESKSDGTNFYNSFEW